MIIVPQTTSPRIIQNAVVKFFVDKDATSESKAVQMTEIDRVILNLDDPGVILNTPRFLEKMGVKIVSGDKYWLDMAKFKEERIRVNNSSKLMIRIVIGLLALTVLMVIIAGIVELIDSTII